MEDIQQKNDCYHHLIMLQNYEPKKDSNKIWHQRLMMLPLGDYSMRDICVTL